MALLTSCPCCTVGYPSGRGRGQETGLLPERGAGLKKGAGLERGARQGQIRIRYVRCTNRTNTAKIALNFMKWTLKRMR